MNSKKQAAKAVRKPDPIRAIKRADGIIREWAEDDDRPASEAFHLILEVWEILQEVWEPKGRGKAK